jgi:hypothetical protein
MIKRKQTIDQLPNKIPPISINLSVGNRCDLEAIFRTLTTPYTGCWHVRAYHNNNLILENSGGQRLVSFYLDDKPKTDQGDAE